MGKYRNHDQFGASAPLSYREATTGESYLKDMSAIAPPGMKPRRLRAERFEQHTDLKASALWHRNFDLAMFGGSDLGASGYEEQQLNLESRRK